jgi:lysophospholipase L1-like esterase
VARVAGRLALLLLGLAVGLAAAELVLRQLPRGSARDLRALHELRPDRPWLFGLRPGAEVDGPGGVHYAVNADGFRDRRYARPKPPGTFRIVVLGHSIAFGWGVAQEATYPKQLEARFLAFAPAARVEVPNLGVSGYNPYTEAALFADVGAGYGPDLVLVEFCINDLNDPTLHFDAQTTLRLGAIPDAAFPDPSRRHPLPPPPSLAERACHWSRLCTLLADHATPLPDAALLRDALAAHDDPSTRELAWLRARYGEIAAAAGALGARFAIAVFPYAAQVDGRAPARVQERLAGLGREAGWTTIDLLPAFRAAARGGAPLFSDPWHPTAEGHRVAADAILVQLRCRGLVPLPPDGDCP